MLLFLSMLQMMVAEILQQGHRNCGRVSVFFYEDSVCLVALKNTVGRFNLSCCVEGCNSLIFVIFIFSSYQ